MIFFIFADGISDSFNLFEKCLFTGRRYPDLKLDILDLEESGPYIVLIYFYHLWYI